jgi:hypothetical protein
MTTHNLKAMLFTSEVAAQNAMQLLPHQQQDLSNPPLLTVPILLSTMHVAEYAGLWMRSELEGCDDTLVVDSGGYLQFHTFSSGMFTADSPLPYFGDTPEWPVPKMPTVPAAFLAFYFTFFSNGSLFNVSDTQPAPFDGRAIHGRDSDLLQGQVQLGCYDSRAFQPLEVATAITRHSSEISKNTVVTLSLTLSAHPLLAAHIHQLQFLVYFKMIGASRELVVLDNNNQICLNDCKMVPMSNSRWHVSFAITSSMLEFWAFMFATSSRKPVLVLLDLSGYETGYEHILQGVLSQAMGLPYILEPSSPPCVAEGCEIQRVSDRCGMACGAY